jgi:hypothetical protein
MEILEDISDQALARAIEENMYAMTPLTHGWPKSEAYAGKDVSWCVTDIGFHSCNPIVRINLNPESVNGVLAMLTDKARKKKVNLQCRVTRNTRPANIAVYLNAHGFIKTGEPTGMAIDLKNLNEENKTPKGFSITEVKNNKMLKTWCQVVGASFSTWKEYMVPSFYDWFSREMEMEQPFRFFLGMLDGKPVATSAYYLGEGVCGLYWVGTLPEARNKGIGSSITQKPLMEAKKMGYRVGILQASEMGKPMYLKLGFKEYGKIESYSWLYAANNGVKNGQNLNRSLVNSLS